jgi:hypothetical protein
VALAPSPSASARSRTRSAGASRAMLDLARNHALERMQFGRRSRGSRPCATVSRMRSCALEALGRGAERRAGGAGPRHGGSREGRRGTHGAHRRPGTASRCSPASASPPSTRSIAS